METPTTPRVDFDLLHALGTVPPNYTIQLTAGQLQQLLADVSYIRKTMSRTMEEVVFNQADACAFLGIKDDATIRKWEKHGLVRVSEIGGCKRYLKSDLLKTLDKCANLPSNW